MIIQNIPDKIAIHDPIRWSGLKRFVLKDWLDFVQRCIIMITTK